MSVIDVQNGDSLPSSLSKAPIAKPASSTFSQPIVVQQREYVPWMTKLLDERIRKYDIVMPPLAPITDRVLVWPLPEEENTAKVGSIHLAPTTTKKHAAQLGVVVAMGARAHEELYSHGIELGHVVLTAKFTPTSWEYVAEGKVRTVLVMRSGDIQGSRDLRDMFVGGSVGFVRDSATGRVELDDRGRIDPVQADDQG